jgi:hypothetical protein
MIMTLKSAGYSAFGGSVRRRKVSLCVGVIVMLAVVISVTSLALAASTFPDVPSNHPYYTAIGDLASRGIIGGYENGNFGPANQVTRQQFAKMIVLTGGYPVSEADVCPFTDVEKGGATTLFPDNYIAVCAAKGITTGATATTFNSSGNITRLQVISMVVRTANDLRPGLLTAPPAGWSATGTWGLDATHGANAARAEYNGLLSGLDLSSLTPTGNMTRGEVAQVLHNLLVKLTPVSTTTTTVAPTTTTTVAPTTTTTASTTTTTTGTVTAFDGDTRFTNAVDDTWAGYTWIPADPDDLGDDQDDDATEEEANPNFDRLAVAMFDKYGNAIAGYRVAFEIVDQGETDSGSIDTYHPYAHFSDFAHTVDEVVAEPGMSLWKTSYPAGIYDRGKFVDANLIWDDPDEDYGDYDDDKAVGYTLNGAINFDYDLHCAAWAELMLDETYGMLESMVSDGDADHFTTKVNVKVYSPTGAFVADFYFTKEWTLETAEIYELVLAISKYDNKGWATSLTTAEDTVFFRVQLLDQWGNPWTKNVTAGDNITLRLGGEEGTVVLTGAPDDEGYLYTSYTYSIEDTYIMRAFEDDDADGALDTGESRSNTATYINQ